MSTPVYSLAWSPDSRYLAAGRGDNDGIDIWDMATGGLIATLHGHRNTIFTLAWSADGARLASGSWDGTVRIWDTANWQLLQLLERHDAIVRSVSWQPGVHRLASLSDDNTIRLWDTDTGEQTQILESFSFTGGLVWGPDSQQIAATSIGQRIHVWNVATGQQIVVLRVPIPQFPHRNVAWLPNNALLVANPKDTDILEIWNAWTREIVAQLDVVGPPDLVAWSPDGTRLAITQADQSIRNWETTTWQVLSTWEYRPQVNPGERPVGIHDLAWSPDGTRLGIAEYRYGGTVIVLNVQTGQTVMTLEGNPDWLMRSVAWSPRGDQIMGGNGDTHGRGQMIVWDVATGNELLTIGSLVEIAWHPDGRVIATDGFYDDSGRLDPYAINILEGGQTVTTLTGHTGEVDALTWSPDGTMLASGSTDSTLRLWGR